MAITQDTDTRRTEEDGPKYHTCGSSECRTGECGLFCACACHYVRMRPRPFDGPTGTPPQSQISLQAIQLTSDHYKTHDVLQQISDMSTWHYGMVPEPNKKAIVKAREIAMGVGVLHPAGPDTTILVPSVQGGVAMTFVREGRDISVVSLNDQTLLVVLGTCWFGTLRSWEMSAEESAKVVAQIREIFSKAEEYDKATGEDQPE